MKELKESMETLFKTGGTHMACTVFGKIKISRLRSN